jgi:hypothetical protein
MHEWNQTSLCIHALPVAARIRQFFLRIRQNLSMWLEQRNRLMHRDLQQFANA